MSDDGREGPATKIDTPPKSEQVLRDAAASKKDISTIRPPPSANLMPGGTEHTAGGQTKPVTAADAVKSIKLEDFKELHKKPCVRDAFLNGIPSGVAAGVVWTVLRAPVTKAANWAVGTFCAVSFVSYEYCQYNRSVEKDGMKRAMQVMEQKRSDRDEKLKAAREERRRAKEEADRKEDEQKKSWRIPSWAKFW
ncbi:MAG: hypothetical protein M1821_004652 [Bathelium mastoideum]|nr:MAG: hypothetical protein M1821_004652 [Bathelium mastoideum]